MNKGLILATALLTAFSFSAHGQQCSDEEMKKVMSESSNNKKLDEINQKKFDEKVDALAKLKHWNDSQTASYGMKVLANQGAGNSADNPLTLAMDMMNAIQKRDCKKVAEINKKSEEANKKMWASLFKKIDDDIASVK
jgi:hypothetical protein